MQAFVIVRRAVVKADVSIAATDVFRVQLSPAVSVVNIAIVMSMLLILLMFINC